MEEDIKSNFELFIVRSRLEDCHMSRVFPHFGDVQTLCVIKKRSFAKRKDDFILEVAVKNTT